MSTWSNSGERDLYDVGLAPAGGGLFTPTDVTLFARLPQEGTGAIQYVPSGPLAGSIMYVNWDYGEVRVLTIDAATGLPIDRATQVPTLGTDDPIDERFAYDLGVGPWGLEFDPRTNDFFLATWMGTPDNTIMQIGGAGFPPPSGEICDNCADDDGDGLVDSEDPACCGQQNPASMTIKRATMAPRTRGGGTRLVLKGDLGAMGLDRPPTAQDLVLQVRAGDATDAFCACIPAGRLRAKKDGLRFKDPKGTVSEARGLTRVTLRVRRSGAILLKAHGSRTALAAPAAGAVRVTWGMHGAGGGDHCSTMLGNFRPSGKGGLRYP